MIGPSFQKQKVELIPPAFSAVWVQACNLGPSIKNI